MSDLPPPSLPPPDAAPVTPPVAVADGWQRMHPATPFLRSWQALVIVAFFFGQDIVESVATGGERDGIGTDLVENGAIGAAIGLAVLTLVVGWAGLSWRFTRYRVTADALELHQGVVSRQQRRAPLDRLQAVDITEPLVARLFGLAKLTLEVAGGGNSKIEIAYLTETQARRLRDHLLAAAAGLRTDAEAPPQIGEAPEQAAIEVPVGRLIGSIALSSAAPVLILFVPAILITALTTGEFAVAALGFPVLLGLGAVLWGQLTSGFGFRVASAADGVRLRYGLLEQRTQTVPPGRVQAIRVHQPLLWRLTDWWVVEVNVAGYGASSSNNDSAPSSRLLPVGTRDEALAVLAFVIADTDVVDGAADALAGSGDHGGFVGAPRRARWADPVSWRRHGFRVTPAALLLRGGWLHRTVDVVPHARTQSWGAWQGPLQRRLGLASFELHSTPGPIKPRVNHMTNEVVAGLVEEQAARSRAARAIARDAWLAPPVTDTVA